jgi:hypothetical protein
MTTTTPKFATPQERKTFEIGMAEARRKGWKPLPTIQELEAKTKAEGLAIIAKRLESARRSKSLAAVAKPDTRPPFTLTPANLAAFKRGLKQAILPVLLAAVPKAPARPAPPARRTLHRIFHHGGLW